MTVKRHDDVQDVLAAFALDAVDADEAAVIEDHLRECPRCRAEVAAHRETAALLVHTHLEPPVDLWDRVAADLEEAAPPPLELSRYVQPRFRPGSPRVARVASLAAAIAAVLVLATSAFWQQREVNDMQVALDEQQLAVSALAAFDEPQGRRATLLSQDGELELPAVVLPDGSGYLLASRLPPVPRNRAYQLWTMVEGVAVSAGVLDADAGVVTFNAPKGTSALALSIERAGGAAEPTLPASLTGLLEA